MTIDHRLKQAAEALDQSVEQVDVVGRLHELPKRHRAQQARAAITALAILVALVAVLRLPSRIEDTAAPTTSQTILQVTGNLLRNWSFEQNTNGWHPSGPVMISQELGGRTSSSSMFVQALAAEPNSMSVIAPDIIRVRPGEIYKASAWVRSGTPGMRVTLRLVVNGQGTPEATPKTIMTPADPGWVRIDVQHRVKAAGALALEVVLENAKQGEGLLVDEVIVRRT